MRSREVSSSPAESFPEECPAMEDVSECSLRWNRRFETFDLYLSSLVLR
jgi:hypothetical protein